MGIFYTGIDTDWFKVFLGAMVLIAVLFNNYIRAQGDGGEMSDDGSRRSSSCKSVTKYFGSVIARSRTSRWRSAPARSTACSATTAPASRR